MTRGAPRIRVLIVDDSAYNRRAIAKTFQDSGEIEVVASAADGNEALRYVYMLSPDVITLDLEMPRMDGFSFLKVLMASRPTPVIVVSSYSDKENVFRALELGAVDFVPKPDGSDLTGGLGPLLQKVLLFRRAQSQQQVKPRPSMVPRVGRREMPTLAEVPRMTPRHLVGIVASTGGPTALGELFSELSPRGSYAVLVAQHMPDKFTRTFAERLDKKSVLEVTEAADRAVVTTQKGFVCPGRQCLEVEPLSSGKIGLRVVPPTESDRYVPSGDRLLATVARTAGSRSVAVILTGMGDDGVEGARAVAQAGGIVIAESEETAVIYGMPRAVASAGIQHETLPLYAIARRLDEILG